MKRTPLRRKGKSDTAKAKDRIQALLRQIVMLRDSGCIRCKVPMGTEGVIWQCDHLITRSSSATYADSRLCVLICKNCHAWKSLGSNLRKKEYDELVRSILPKERVELWERAEKESWRPQRKFTNDWKLHIVVLTSELAKLKEEML